MKHPEVRLKTPEETAKNLRHMYQTGCFDEGQDLRTNILMVVYAIQELCDWLTHGQVSEVQGSCELEANVRERARDLLDMQNMQGEKTE